MNKEILEITKKFHDTYEKLAIEYTYETREDTKVFDINSNNGKLMYATVNEIVSPILEENQELKSQLAGTTHCFDEEEHRKLKDEIKKLERIIELCHLDAKETLATINYEQESQQKAFIKFLENELHDARYYACDIAQFIEYVLQKYKKITQTKIDKSV